MTEVMSVYVMDPNTGEETHYPSVSKAAEAIGVTARSVRSAVQYGYKCRGYICRKGEPVKYEQSGCVRRPIRPNICFDCKNACGKCSWSAVDPVTGKVKFEPVPGWTAEKVTLNLGHICKGTKFVETYHITACPLFEHDEPRKTNNLELTYTESEDFKGLAGYLVKRWEHG
jgi:hypothetical protein